MLFEQDIKVKPQSNMAFIHRRRELRHCKLANYCLQIHKLTLLCFEELKYIKVILCNMWFFHVMNIIVHVAFTITSLQLLVLNTIFFQKHLLHIS